MSTTTRRRTRSQRNQRKYNRRQITQFIRDWITETITHYNYPDFNHLLEQGYCADLADNIWHRFSNTRGEGLEFHNTGDDPLTPVHTWIEYDGYHFDMQNPEGVRDWTKMLYFKDCANPILDTDD